MCDGGMEATWHHVAISVKDLDRALKFYRDLLGFKVDWDRDHYSGEECRGWSVCPMQMRTW